MLGLTKISCGACLLFYCFFGDEKRIAFESFLGRYFQPLITEFFSFRIVGKMHTEAVARFAQSLGNLVVFRKSTMSCF